MSLENDSAEIQKIFEFAKDPFRAATRADLKKRRGNIKYWYICDECGAPAVFRRKLRTEEYSVAPNGDEILINSDTEYDYFCLEHGKENGMEMPLW